MRRITMFCAALAIAAAGCGGGGGGGSSAFCDAVQRVADLGANVQSGDVDPQEALGQIEEILQELADTAPDEISDQVDASLEGDQQADQEVQEYILSECGIDFSDL